MTTFVERILANQFEKRVVDLETRALPGGGFEESLPLHLGDTTLTRTILPSGQVAGIKVCTQESQGAVGNVIYRKYILKEGNLFDAYDAERTITKFRKASLIAKIILSRPDHWDKETDFYGVEEEE